MYNTVTGEWETKVEVLSELHKPTVHFPNNFGGALLLKFFARGRFQASKSA